MPTPPRFRFAFPLFGRPFATPDAFTPVNETQKAEAQHQEISTDEFHIQITMAGRKRDVDVSFLPDAGAAKRPFPSS